jgi:hypothetical protein
VELLVISGAAPQDVQGRKDIFGVPSQDRLVQVTADGGPWSTNQSFFVYLALVLFILISGSFFALCRSKDDQIQSDTNIRCRHWAHRGHLTT